MKLDMKVYLLVVCYCVVFCAAKSRRLSKIVELTSVTYFDGINVYYTTVKDQKIGNPPKEAKKPTKRVKIKKNLCMNIFSTPYFEMKNEDVLDLDSLPNRMTLLNQDPDLFDAIFVGRENWSWVMSGEDTFDFEYENKYQLLPVRFEGANKSRYFFRCLVREYKTQKIKQYLVSEEYNVNLVDPIRAPIAGRFIFAYDRDNNLKIEALAEESAVGSMVVKTRVAELYYVKRRKFDGRTETPGMDPICRLPPGNKLRLCASIFSSIVMQNRFRFLPSIENVLLYCERKKISFLAAESLSMRAMGKVIRATLENDRIYDEWMIGCRVMPISSSSYGSYGRRNHIIYYISRGDLENSVFGYIDKFFDTKLFVDSYFNNVSVAGVVDQNLDLDYEEAGSETASDSSFTSAKSTLSQTSSSKQGARANPT